MFAPEETRQPPCHGEGNLFYAFLGVLHSFPRLRKGQTRRGSNSVRGSYGTIKVKYKGKQLNYFELGGARYRPIKGYGRYASTGPVHSAPRPLLNQNKHRCIRNLYVYLRLAAETPSVQLFGTICQPPGTPAKAQTLETYP